MGNRFIRNDRISMVLLGGAILGTLALGSLVAHNYRNTGNPFRMSSEGISYPSPVRFSRSDVQFASRTYGEVSGPNFTRLGAAWGFDIDGDGSLDEAFQYTGSRMILDPTMLYAESPDTWIHLVAPELETPLFGTNNTRIMTGEERNDLNDWHHYVRRIQ